MTRKPHNIGSRREIFVDRFLIDSLQGAELKLHRPVPAGAALRFDRPWEGPFSFYGNVFMDGDKYLLYYRGWPDVDLKKAGAVACLATSDDGVHWKRPELGLFEVKGSRRNNVLLCGDEPVTHNFCAFLDARPGAPEAERFKAVGGSHKTGLLGFVSADGIHWRRIQEGPILTIEKFGFDSQNVAFWSEAEGRYLLYFRTFHPQPDPTCKHGVRWVSRSESEDFLNWSEPVEMDAGDTPYEHLYTQQTHPYFRAPHIYIALPARFMPGRCALTEAQAAETGVHEKYWHDCSDTVLMTSRGGNRYDRTFMESFIRPGIGDEHWVSRTNYAGLGVVPTGPAEMSLFVNRRYAQPAAYLERMTLRTDGFASLHAGYGGGETITRPVIFEGDELEINYATSAAGSVKFEVQDESGKPIPEFALDRADEVLGDEIERVVTWNGSSDVAALAGRPIRLRVLLKDADVFSLKFGTSA